jgi:hypothetical protein
MRRIEAELRRQRSRQKSINGTKEIGEEITERERQEGIAIIQVFVYNSLLPQNREGLVKKLILILASTLVLGSTAVSANAQTQAPGSGWTCGTFEYANRCNAIWRFTSQHCECLGAASRKFLRIQALIFRGEPVSEVMDNQSIHSK